MEQRKPQAVEILCSPAIGNRNGIECEAHILPFLPQLKIERGKPIGNLDKSAKELNDVNDMLSRKQRRVFW